MQTISVTLVVLVEANVMGWRFMQDAILVAGYVYAFFALSSAYAAASDRKYEIKIMGKKLKGVVAKVRSDDVAGHVDTFVRECATVEETLKTLWNTSIVFGLLMSALTVAYASTHNLAVQTPQGLAQLYVPYSGYYAFTMLWPWMFLCSGLISMCVNEVYMHGLVVKVDNGSLDADQALSKINYVRVMYVVADAFVTWIFTTFSVLVFVSQFISNTTQFKVDVTAPVLCPAPNVCQT